VRGSGGLDSSDLPGLSAGVFDRAISRGGLRSFTLPLVSVPEVPPNSQALPP